MTKNPLAKPQYPFPTAPAAGKPPVAAGPRTPAAAATSGGGDDAGLPMGIKRVLVTSDKWEQVLPANPRRQYLRVAVSADLMSQVPGAGGQGSMPTSVYMALDSINSNDYSLVWILKPAEPRRAPTNAVFLRAAPNPAQPNTVVSVWVEVWEG